MQKNKTFRLLVGSVVAFLACQPLLHAESARPLISDEQPVIIKASKDIDTVGVEQIGSTEYYQTTMQIARELKSEGDAYEIHAPLDYQTSLTPNDPLEMQGYLSLLDAEDLWTESTGSNTVTVAVIDSGFALGHEDLAGRWYLNPGEAGGLSTNGIDDDSNGFIDDWRGWDFAYDDNNPSAGSVDPDGDAAGHGTAVAGMIGATGNNATGGASLNWQAKIMPLQIFTDDGIATTYEVALAMDYAILMGADVINLSLGSAGSDAVVDGLIDDAQAAGIVVVAAAGNCGGSDFISQGCSFQGQTKFPATNNKTIAVAATTLTDTRATFSSYGSAVDIAAPGSGSIITTLYDKTDANGAYSGSIFGTSFSAPTVSGLAALLKAEWSSANAADIRALLVDSALKTSEMGASDRTDFVGYGRIVPLAALDRAQACKLANWEEDINCDGSVSLFDLSLLISEWLYSQSGRTDINQSGDTNLFDLSLLISKWGQ